MEFQVRDSTSVRDLLLLCLSVCEIITLRGQETEHRHESRRDRPNHLQAHQEANTYEYQISKCIHKQMHA